jgi:hypothetical protein
MWSSSPNVSVLCGFGQQICVDLYAAAPVRWRGAATSCRARDSCIRALFSAHFLRVLPPPAPRAATRVASRVPPWMYAYLHTVWTQIPLVLFTCSLFHVYRGLWFRPHSWSAGMQLQLQFQLLAPVGGHSLSAELPLFCFSALFQDVASFCFHMWVCHWLPSLFATFAVIFAYVPLPSRPIVAVCSFAVRAHAAITTLLSPLSVACCFCGDCKTIAILFS